LARVLIVGCGCRGRELAAALAADGHAVRGTTRDPGNVRAIGEARAEAALADPDRLDTLLPHLAGVSVMCWLMGTATGPEEDMEALHGPRLTSIAAKLVDSHVHGLVYEAAGTLRAELFAEGARSVRQIAEENRVPLEVVEEDPAQPELWAPAMRAAVERVLA